MTIRRRQVVFLAICSGDRTLIREWADRGDLPNLARLLDGGLVGETVGLPGVYVGAHWPSWITACHPGKSGVHSWNQLATGSYDEFRCRAGDVMRRRQFWEWLSDAGRRVCVLDIPHSRITPGINGLQTVEWGAHDAAYGYHASSPALDREIRGEFGLHPVSGNSDADRSPEELIAFRDQLIRGIRMKGALTRHFYAKERWDFFAQVFTEAHCAGHLLWHLHDPDYRWSRGNDPTGAGDALKDIYVAIDREIGALLDRLDSDAHVIFLANHGMRAKYHANHLLERILVGLGYASPKAITPRSPRLTERLDPAMTWAWRHLPESLRAHLTPLRDIKRKLVNGDPPRPPVIEPAESLAFTVTNNSAHGAIRVNLIGREPAGRVAPGAEYESLLERIELDLKGLRNLDTGGPVVDAVYRCDDLYPGPERINLPDLFIAWTGGAPVQAVGSNRLPRLEGEYRYVRSGEHHPGGLFVAKGPGMGAGRIDRPLTCLDFAPTIAALLDVEPDADIDGTAIRELVPEPAIAPRGA